MYEIATCTASIYRGQTLDEFGGPVPVGNLVASGVIAAIQEQSSRVFDSTSQTPRVVRTVAGFMPAGTDIRINDRVRDDTNGVSYWVDNVVTPRAPGYRPDVVLDLRRVN